MRGFSSDLMTFSNIYEVRAHVDIKRAPALLARDLLLAISLRADYSDLLK